MTKTERLGLEWILSSGSGILAMFIGYYLTDSELIAGLSGIITMAYVSSMIRVWDFTKS
jgi:hypothetical protein